MQLIQGLDFIHIFPVIQWLVKRAIETREEFGGNIHSYNYSVSHDQYNKFYTTATHLLLLLSINVLFCTTVVKGSPTAAESPIPCLKSH